MASRHLGSVIVRKIETALAPAVGKVLGGGFDKRRLSQAGFMSLCDGFYPSNLAELIGKKPVVAITDALVVYVQSDLYEEFLAEYPDCKARVLLVGNSDRDWDRFTFPRLPNLRHCLVQNLVQEASEEISPLPIGIENRAHGRNGMPWNFARFLSNRRKKRGLFFGPMGNTHPSRTDLDDIDVSGIPNLFKISTRISSLEFSWRSSGWTHVLAPRGNGIDTHRFWESLYRGSVPVVLKSSWSSNIKKLGIPVVELDEWSALELSVLSEKLTFQDSNSAAIEVLDLRYWRGRIMPFVRMNPEEIRKSQLKLPCKSS